MAVIINKISRNIFRGVVNSAQRVTKATTKVTERQLESLTPNIHCINNEHQRYSAIFTNQYFFLSTSQPLNDQVYFTKTHEWVSVTGNLGTVGITEYAQQALGKQILGMLNWAMS